MKGAGLTHGLMVTACGEKKERGPPEATLSLASQLSKLHLCVGSTANPHKLAPARDHGAKGLGGP